MKTCWVTRVTYLSHIFTCFHFNSKLLEIILSTNETRWERRGKMQSRIRNNPRTKLPVLANNLMVPPIYPNCINLLCSACKFKIHQPLPQRHKKPLGFLEEVYKTPRKFSRFIYEDPQETNSNHAHFCPYSRVWQTLAQLWPNACFCRTQELWMAFIFLNGKKSKEEYTSWHVEIKLNSDFSVHK